MIALFFYWFSIFLLVYTYVGFTVLLILRAYLFPKPYKKEDHYPSVTMLIAAYNEEEDIANKLDNVTQLTYPHDKLEVLVCSDGSEDRTNEIVAQYENDSIRLLALPRMGKASALNTAIKQAKGDILVFSDANSIYSLDAIEVLTRPFVNTEIGGVAGDQQYMSSTTASSGEESYWSFDRYLKKAESQAGNVISATGAIYAIRRHLFQNIPGSVTDDFYTSTRVILQGYRLVFEENAIAYEPPAKNQSREFSRKVRILTRGLNSVVKNRALLNPFKYRFYAVQLFTHKVLRRLMYIPFIILLLSNLFLIEVHWFYALSMLGQVTFYGLALLGILLQRLNIKLPKVFVLPSYIFMVYWAALVASWNLLRGHQIDRWQTQR